MPKKDNFFNTLRKAANNEMAFTIDEENPYTVSEWVDTGCYGLNAVLSDGDILKGMPKGKRIMISGESGVAKSLFIAIMVKAYLDKMENSMAVIFESEASTVVEMAESIGIPPDRLLVVPVGTIEEFRTQCTRMLDTVIETNDAIKKANAVAQAAYDKLKKKGDKKPPVAKTLYNPMFVVDSMGNLGTLQENMIIKTDKRGQKKDAGQTRDMTRAQMIRGMARNMSLKIGLAQTPMLIVNHTYATMDQYSEDETSGGGGLKYMCDVSLILTKAKEKDANKKQIGIMITVKVRKSRYMKENKEVKLLISFTRGMYRFSDMVNKGAELGVLKKSGISYTMPPAHDEKAKVTMANVRKRASKYITGEVFDALQKAIRADFGFGIENGKFDFFDDMESNTESEVESAIDDQLTED